MNKTLHNFFVLFVLFAGEGVFSQYDPIARNIFLNHETQQVIDEWNIKYPNTDFHSSFRPYLSWPLKEFHDSCAPYNHYLIKNFFLSKTLNEGPQKHNQFNFQFLPIVDLQTGYDLLQKKNVNELIGGTHVKLNINNDFTLAGTLVAGQVSYPFLTDTFVKSNMLIPGMGMAYKAGNNSYSFANLSGYASYSPNRIFDFQAGKDKHFLGDGYRSLLLSDVANNYPYFRSTANIWHLQYSIWYSWMYDITTANGIKNKFHDKFATMHYLSWNILKELNISAFENIVWQGADTNRNRGFDVNYLSPVVFFRPQEYSVGSPDNAFMGLNISSKLFGCLKLYGQLAIDEFNLTQIKARTGWWANKQGWQLGAKYINALNVKGLTLQAEYNEVRPYTYSHASVTQNYAHYGQPLAHPFGANFQEYLGFISYRKDRWMLNVQGLYANIGKDSTGVSNVGQNIFLSYTSHPKEFGNVTTQGVKTKFLQSDIRVTYLIVPQMNLRMELGYIQRSERNSKGYVLQDPYFYLGIKTSIWNFYRDY